jgi:hypothetical protein
MKFKIVIWVFQNGRFDEELTFDQEFRSELEIAQAFARFAAQESVMRLDPMVYPLYAGDGPRLNLPSAHQGYGPSTNLVIKTVVRTL